MENKKKLERDTQNKVLGGVCSGLANYFDVDAALIRVLLTVLFFFGSMGFWLYVILWIVMPAAKTNVEMASGQETDGASHAVMEEVNDNTQENKRSPLFGLILIGIGAIGLFHRYVPRFDWQTLWPIMLIVLGIVLLLPSKNRKS